MKIELRYAAHPDDVKNYDTSRLRNEFLIEKVFVQDEITMVYSMFDRYMVGGAMPVKKDLLLESADELKSSGFLDRRELGIINVGGAAVIHAGKEIYNIGFKEALYIGKGTTDVIFKSVDQANPAKLYINSAPAHQTYPSKKVTKAEAEVVVLGNMEASNHRTINKLLVNSIVSTCQLQMGMTELKPGSVWNTMPVIRMKRGISG
jgi:4-deoxy-L-threo-5-hexosulose-uronate ketol-isomerase